MTNKNAFPQTVIIALDRHIKIRYFWCGTYYNKYNCFPAQSWRGLFARDRNIVHLFVHVTTPYPMQLQVVHLMGYFCSGNTQYMIHTWYIRFSAQSRIQPALCTILCSYAAPTQTGSQSFLLLLTLEQTYMQCNYILYSLEHRYTNTNFPVTLRYHHSYIYL